MLLADWGGFEVLWPDDLARSYRPKTVLKGLCP